MRTTSDTWQIEQAATVLALVVRDAPNRADIHRELGYALLQLRRTDESLAHLKEAVRLDPASPEAHDTTRPWVLGRAPQPGGGHGQDQQDQEEVAAPQAIESRLK
jgi:hypothetical protein